MLHITTSPAYGKEKAYAFEVVLREMLGVDFSVSYEGAASHVLALPGGESVALPDCFHHLAKFSEVGTGAFAQDPFAFSFFCLSRWEEAHSAVRDRHGRFPATESVAWKEGFLDRPVVNERADALWDALVSLGWRGQRKRRESRLLLSCDVDHPRLWWSAADRARTLAGSVLKRGDMAEAAFFFRHCVFGKKDPYDVFDEWLELFDSKKLQVQFNFMGERPRSSDSWYPLHHPFVRRTMEKLASRGHAIGFHPSYEAFGDEALFECELDSLRRCSPVEVRSGRQHYLRFEAPRTWRVWEAAGLQEDGTLGYPEAEGFRCGICHDFPVFDLGQRKVLRLREQPLVAMDVTLAQYRRYSPAQAAERLAALMAEVKKHGGDFTLLWHNSSWGTPQWQGWKKVLLDFL